MRTTPIRRMAALAVTLAAVPAAPALGAAGDLDPTFGDGGIRLLEPPSSIDEVLVQADGKILVTGDDPTDQDFWITRLRADGAPDPAFDQDGIVKTDVRGGKEEAMAAGLQPDGRLVVAGTTQRDDTFGLVLARYLDGGALDPSFGAGGDDGDGRVTLPHAYPVAVLPQAAGGLAIVVQVGGSIDTAILRVRGDGSTELAPQPATGIEDGTARAAARGADGGAVVALWSDTSSFVARLTPQGKLDTTFGTMGRTTLPAIADPSDIVALPDGKLLVVGHTGTGREAATAIVRLDAEGRVDETFGQNGVAQADFPGTELNERVRVQSDGGILVTATLATAYEFAAARFTPSGELDATYRAGGLFTFPVLTASAVLAAAVTPDDKLVLVGQASKTLADLHLAVARLQADAPPATDTPVIPQPDTTGDTPQPTPDTQAPALTRLRVTRTHAGAKPRIRFTLSEAARVRLVLRRAGARPVRITAAAAAGPNRIRGTRRLRPGRHRLTAVAIDAAGNRSTARLIRFAVAARAR